MARSKSRADFAKENRALRRRIAKLEKALGHSRGPFVAGHSAPHFHRPKCEYAAWIKPRNFVQFETHEEAVDAGKKPCKTCRA